MTFHQRPSYFQTTQTELLRWDVQRLWQLAAALPVEHCPLSQFAAAFASVVWLGDSPPREGVAAPQPTLGALASYARDSYQADLAYPIILSAEGDVMDGRPPRQGVDAELANHCRRALPRNARTRPTASQTPVKRPLMNAAKRTVLAKFALSEADFLARGMEAEVYRYGDDAVLKLYASTASLTDLRRLQAFYSTIDRSQLSYALPSILSVFDEDAYQVTIERRLVGQPLAALLRRTHPHQLDSLFASYASATLELSTIGMPPTTTAYKLFDPHHLSERSDGDWHQFLRRWLTHQLRVLAPYFERDVDDFPSKLSAMMAVLDRPYRGVERLIHGDICPGNLLVAAGGKPLALLDFGLITMYGDPLFDAATAWVFFDMYERLGANVRQRLLPFFLDLLGAKATGQLYRYVLLYSLLSANTYDPECRDGHYGWCIANLNTNTYWDNIE